MFEVVENIPQNAVIKVVGIGGGGGNVVNRMIANSSEGIDFICANTDAQALSQCKSTTLLQLGSSITNGLGSGANPEIGRQAAIENQEQITEVLRGSDMVFITAGMGGGTGTGAAPVVAKIAKGLGILTVAVVTKPFAFEGQKRLLIAEQGIKELQQHVDSLITIPNEALLATLGKDTSLSHIFEAEAEVVGRAVRSITDLIVRPGMINVDFADVRTILSEMGAAAVGIGAANGDNRAREATERAIHNSFLKNSELAQARGILVNITAGLDLSLGEFSEVGDAIEEYASEKATIVVGTVIDPSMKDTLCVTIVAAGIDSADIASKPTGPTVHDHERMSDQRVLQFLPSNKAQEQYPGYLDIPLFLSEQMADSPEFNWRSTELLKDIDNVCIVSEKGASDREIAELIYHLSNLYKSVGGDELKVENITDLPPDASGNSIRPYQKRRGAGF